MTPIKFSVRFDYALFDKRVGSWNSQGLGQPTFERLRKFLFISAHFFFEGLRKHQYHHVVAENFEMEIFFARLRLNHHADFKSDLAFLLSSSRLTFVSHLIYGNNFLAQLHVPKHKGKLIRNPTFERGQ